jgi:hypothetical protein
MDNLSSLAAIAAIQTLKSRYFQAIDCKDWELLGEVMADDVVCDCRGATTDPVSGLNVVPAATDDLLVGKAQAIGAAKSGLAGIVSVHQGFMPDIEIVGETAARGNWAMVDRLKLPSGGPLAELIGYGHYHETYERIGGKWKIKTLKLTRLRIDAIPAA